MEREIRDKVVVVTGGANGLGYEIASSFLSEHAGTVVLLDINEDQGCSAVHQLTQQHGRGRAVFIRCDVTKDIDEISEKIFKEYQQIDVLVNSAGILDEYDFKAMFAINTVALVEWSMKLFDHMRTDKNGKGGTIINIGSVYSFKNDPFLIHYKASKFAVLGFTSSLGHPMNYDMFGVRLFTICPGLTRTNMTSKGMTWLEHQELFSTMSKEAPWQTPDVAARRVIEVFRKADSGTAWVVTGGGLTQYTMKTMRDILGDSSTHIF